MGQKVHPLGFRLGVTKNHHAQFCAPNARLQRQACFEDYCLRLWIDQYAKTCFRGEKLKDGTPKRAIIGRVVIRRRPRETNKHGNMLDKVHITICTPHPSIFVGNTPRVNGKETLNHFQIMLANKLAKVQPKESFTGRNPKTLLTFHIRRFVTGNHPAGVAFKLAHALEARKGYRKIFNAMLEYVTDNQWGGLRILISGRIFGSEMARKEQLRFGSLPCQTLRSKVAYASLPAVTNYGLLGIKVWTYLPRGGKRLQRPGKRKSKLKRTLTASKRT